MKKSALCRWWGHAIDPDASYYYGHDICVRCARTVDGDTGLREFLSVRWWLTLRWIRDRWSDARHWVTCTDCGRHFGRHEDAIDHLPF